MYTIHDERCGVVKTTWNDIEPRLREIKPTLSQLINEVSPGPDYPIYLVYLPYGMLKGDTESSFLPTMEGGYTRLTDPSLPSDIQQDLGYGALSSPLGIVLENSIEYYIEFNGDTIPYDLAKPGYIFNKSILLNLKSPRNYSPNGILKASAGARTAFCLSSINNFNNILKVNSALSSDILAPKKATAHGQVFKKMCQAPSINSQWRTCLIYFSEKWVDSMASDFAWRNIKYHLLEEERAEAQFQSKSIYYDIFYSHVQNKHNLKISSPYLTHTVTHLFKLALGQMPAYAPADSELCLPLQDIQECLYQHYDILQHPSIMVPQKYHFESRAHPIYYSLQTPSMPSFSIKRNNRVSANKEIEALNLMIPKYLQEMNEEQGILKDTVFDALAQKICFSYYHNVPSNEHLVKHSSLLEQEDPRFMHNHSDCKPAHFCHEGQFLRGCIKIHS